MLISFLFLEINEISKIFKENIQINQIDGIKILMIFSPTCTFIFLYDYLNSFITDASKYILLLYNYISKTVFRFIKAFWKKIIIL